MRTRTWLLVALTLGGAGAPAAADPGRVEYVVGRRALRAEVTARANLDFELYGDEGCGTLLSSHKLGISDPNLRLESFESLDFAPLSRAQILHPHGMVRIQAVLDLPALPAASVYLRVRGPGIEPSGTDCQLQTVATAGEPGPEGPPGRDAIESLVAEGEWTVEVTKGEPSVTQVIAPGDPGEARRVCFLTQHALGEVGVLDGLATCAVVAEKDVGWLLVGSLENQTGQLTCSARCLSW